MNRKEKRQLAQDLLLHGMMNTFYNLDQRVMAYMEKTEELEEFRLLLRAEAARVEKLFGYKPYTFK